MIQHDATNRPSIRRIVIAAAAAGTAGVVLRRLGRRSRVDATPVSDAESAYLAAGTKILILGGGFAGLETALSLDRGLKEIDPDARVSVLVVDRTNDLLFTPLLWTVADGRSSPSDVVVPIRSFQRGRGFQVLHAEIEAIDLSNKTVATTAGPRPYDLLVIALGSVTAVPDLPGLREYARLFHSPADAVELRNTIIDAIEAAHRATDPDERRAWLTFVVGGGGDTGIELAATIRDYLTAGLLKTYPWLADEPARIVVVGRADRLVPMSSARTSETVRRVLEGEGIEVLTGVSIDRVTAREVGTSRGDIPARTIFWAAGISAPPPVRALPVSLARNGAVIVNDRLQIEEHPDVFVVGDAAWAVDPATGGGVPPTAQAARYEGRYVGETIVAGLAGRSVAPFRFAPRGRLALLGHRTGVAEIKGVTFSGLPAWLLWHAYYLSAIPSWRNRLHLVTDWLLAWMTGRETAQLRLGRPVHAESESVGASNST